jgi:hypothetical protein
MSKMLQRLARNAAQLPQEDRLLLLAIFILRARTSGGKSPLEIALDYCPRGISHDFYNVLNSLPDAPNLTVATVKEIVATLGQP